MKIHSSLAVSLLVLPLAMQSVLAQKQDPDHVPGVAGAEVSSPTHHLFKAPAVGEEPLKQWHQMGIGFDPATLADHSNMVEPEYHVLMPRPAHSFVIPGDWSKCVVYTYRKMDKNAEKVGTSMAFYGGNDGKLRIAYDKSKCPPGYYENGIRIGTTKLIVRGYLYSMDPYGIVTHAEPVDPSRTYVIYDNLHPPKSFDTKPVEFPTISTSTPLTSSSEVPELLKILQKKK